MKNDTTKETMSVKDVATIAVLSVLEMVLIVFFMTVLFLVPAIYQFAFAIASIPMGIIAMLMLSRVNRSGTLLINGSLLALMMLFTGHPIITPILVFVGAVVSEFVWRLLKRTSFLSMAVGYATFITFYTLAGFGPFALMRESAMADAISKGSDPATLERATMFLTPTSLPIVLIVSFVAAIIGAMIGKGVLRKHFEKAGIV